MDYRSILEGIFSSVAFVLQLSSPSTGASSASGASGAGGASGGYARGTGSVVAGLTAALWDLDSAKVEGGTGGGLGGGGVGGLSRLFLYLFWCSVFLC